MSRCLTVNEVSSHQGWEEVKYYVFGACSHQLQTVPFKKKNDMKFKTPAQTFHNHTTCTQSHTVIKYFPVLPAMTEDTGQRAD